MLVPVAAVAAGSWPQWRGPSRDGVLTGFQAPARWPKQLTRRWRVPVGEGHASPIVADGAIFVFSREGGQEVLRRLDLNTGREIWKARQGAPYQVNPDATAHGSGPKSTPTYHDGRLYTLGISGILSCFDARSGRVRWRLEFSRRFNATSPLYGAAMSPLVADGLVIAHVGGHSDGALTAFDATTGRVRWRWNGDGPSYASPILATIDGERQVVTQTQRYCLGVALANGALRWHLPFTTAYDQSSVTPVAAGGVLIFGGYQQPTFGVRVRKRVATWRAERIWEARGATCYLSTPVADGAWVYGMSERRQGQLFALDPATGAIGWTGPGRLGENAALVNAGSVLFVLTTDGQLAVHRKQNGTLVPVARYTVADSPTWASPAILGSRIVVKDRDSVALWEIGR